MLCLNSKADYESQCDKHLSVNLLLNTCIYNVDCERFASILTHVILAVLQCKTLMDHRRQKIDALSNKNVF